MSSIGALSEPERVSRLAPAPSASDRVLVHDAQSGCEQSFVMLVERHQQSLSLYLHALDPDLGADAAQDALLRARHNLPQLRDGTVFRAWLFRIGARLLVDLQRQRTRRWRRYLPLAWVEPGSSRLPWHAVSTHPDLASQVADRDEITRVLHTLSDTDRTVLLLRHLGGCSAREIGELLDLSSGATQRQLNRAEH